MLRSELIVILQKQTEEHGRDGEIKIEVFGQCEDPEETIGMEILSIGEASGWGEALTVIDAGRPINEYPEDGKE